MKLEVEIDYRGLGTVPFYDFYRWACTLQESSAEDDRLVQLRVGYGDVGAMYLSRENVAALLPHLERFVKTGYLREKECPECGAKPSLVPKDRR